MTASIVEAAEGLQEIVEAHADKAEQNRRLPKRLVQALRDSHLMRMCVPLRSTTDPRSTRSAW